MNISRHLVVLFTLATCGLCYGKGTPYIQATSGWMMGGYGPAPSEAMVGKIERERDSLSPSIALGYQFTDMLGIELGYTKYGSAQYDAFVDPWYGYWVHPTVVIDIKNSIRETPTAWNLKMPFRFQFSKDFALNLGLGVSYQELKRTGTSTYFGNPNIDLVTGKLVYPAPVTTNLIVRRTYSWAPLVSLGFQYKLSGGWSALVESSFTKVAKRYAAVASAGLEYRF